VAVQAPGLCHTWGIIALLSLQVLADCGLPLCLPARACLQGAVITQCFPSYYYAVHETGHRLGFRHANMYRLAGAAAAPVDPLGPGATTTSGYT
jgi:hypothetical protein